MSQSEAPSSNGDSQATSARAARFTISPATYEDIPDVGKLFTLYAGSLNVDLAFQFFAEELAELPGKYAPPDGQILLAKLAPQASQSQGQNGHSNGQNGQSHGQNGHSNSGNGQSQESIDQTDDELSRQQHTALSTVANPYDVESLINDDIIPEAIGCVALRPITFSPPWDRGDPNIKKCEMKRLYTLPSTRGQGVGKALIEGILKVAQEMGYDEMYLDTLPTMTAALGVYERFGFVRTEPYYHNPNEGVVFLVKKLGAT
ncbi:hypothetical protein H072_905 [Dactylellina haptotyla CBS 200.50]|uniref:N-acetyltransferase domain-containing protein n=1 Tax=Dactylellina haptotyla (strain CBS 200.50) TaxID=1284197 RepID=S8C078_DACHA|nr:hypothetical protein H072_905 [Dactylellina haptotyla CBS 200.50]